MDISNKEYHKTMTGMKSSSVDSFNGIQEQADTFWSMKKRTFGENKHLRFSIRKDDESNIKCHVPKDERNTEMTVP